MKTIDLRSDTLTQPSAAMRKVMAEAAVGDDVYGEDPTVNELEAYAADMLGTEAAMFVASGTQSNLLALISHCERGDEYIVGQQAHNYKYEAGGAAVLGSIQPQPLETEEDGTIALEAIRSAIKPDDFHFARTRLLSLENTHAGKVLPMSYLEQAAALAKGHNLGMLLDGARIFNAAVKLQVPVTQITQHFDSISVCLSKGLGAPVGSVLCSTKERIESARRWRKMVGGAMRQAGILAAAGLFAMKNNVERLEEDHANALRLAAGLSQVEDLAVNPATVQTNMVFFDMQPEASDALTQHLEKKGIRIGGYGQARLVTHMDVSQQDIDFVVEEIKAFFRR